MKTLRFITVILLFVGVFNLVSFAQKDSSANKTKYNSWSATVSGGSMLFYGDLRQFDFYPISKKNSTDWYHFTTPFSERKWGFGLAINKQLSPIFGLQLMMQDGKLAGMKRKIRDEVVNAENSYFNASIFSYGLNIKINILPILNPNIAASKISIYGLAGFGLCSFKTMRKTIDGDVEVYSYGYGENGQKNKRTTEYIIPVGAGIKYDITNNIAIGLECTLNNVNTDKLDADNVVGSSKDKYQYTSLTVTYTLGKKQSQSIEFITPKKQEEKTNFAPIYAALNKMNKKIDSLGNKFKEVDSLGNKLNETDNKTNQLIKDVADLKAKSQQQVAIPQQDLGNIEAAVEAQFSVYFEVNSVNIDELNLEKIAAASEILKGNPSLKFNLVGHADKTGGELYNKILSKNRAQAVYNLLVNSYGIDGSRLSVDGAGTNNPISKDILSVNRRVDFIKK